MSESNALSVGGQGGETRALSTLPVANRWEWRLRRTLANAAIDSGDAGRYSDALQVLAMIATDTGLDGKSLGIEWRTRRLAAADLFRLGLRADEVLLRASKQGEPDASGVIVEPARAEQPPTASTVVVTGPAVVLHFDRPSTADVAAALSALTQGAAGTNGKAHP